MDSAALTKLSRLIRYWILKMTYGAGSGHPTSCFSAVDLMTVLFFKYLRVNFANFESPVNDRLIFSKGHASALFYSLYAAAGKLTEEELMGYRTFDSVLEGHPTRRFPFTEAATGSLGQGLSIGAGEALAQRARMLNDKFQMKNENKESYLQTNIPRVFVLLGDGELAEGSVWEAANWASFKKLNNLVAICDINRFGQAEETMWQHDLTVYERRFTAFGWSTIVIDGHNYQEINAALEKAIESRIGPVAIIARTIKGKGIGFWEDKPGWHNKMLPKEEYEKALTQLSEGLDKNYRGVVSSVAEVARKDFDPASEVASHRQSETGQNFVGSPQHSSSVLTYVEPVATKKAFGNALERLGKDYPQLLVLDGDMSNSTHTDQFQKAYPDRFIQMYIAEQNMVGVAVGLARRGYLPFVSTFACFLSTRAHDQIRMASLSQVKVLFNGAYGGVSMGKDGPSQMGLEDLAIFRGLQEATVLYPSDPYQTEKLVEAMLKQKGICYIRTTREPTPVIYKAEDEFPVGGSKTFESSGFVEAPSSFWQTSQRVRPESRPDTGNPDPGQARTTNKSKKLDATIVAAGITLHEALKAQKQLASEGILVRVIDCYSVKPIDTAALKKAASETKAIIVVEDHYPEGGLGEAVKSALSDSRRVPIIHLAVFKTPRSGTPEELLAYEEIDAASIVKAVKSVK